jgi:hypothetical protein
MNTSTSDFLVCVCGIRDKFVPLRRRDGIEEIRLTHRGDAEGTEELFLQQLTRNVQILHHLVDWKVLPRFKIRIKKVPINKTVITFRFQ